MDDFNRLSLYALLAMSAEHSVAQLRARCERYLNERSMCPDNAVMLWI